MQFPEVYQPKAYLPLALCIVFAFLFIVTTKLSQEQTPSGYVTQHAPYGFKTYK